MGLFIDLISIAGEAGVVQSVIYCFRIVNLYRQFRLMEIKQNTG